MVYLFIATSKVKWKELFGKCSKKTVDHPV